MPVVGRRVQVRLDAPAEQVRERTTRVLAESPRPVSALEFDVRPEGEQASVLELQTRPAPRVPYFGWFLRVMAALAARGDLRDAAARVRADLAGAPPPRRRPRLLLVPPADFSVEQAAALATVAAVGALANFGGALLTQDGDAVTSSFGRSDQALGFALALTRAGVLVSLVAAALADRYGRRRLLLVGLVGICVANGLAAAAPTFEVFVASQLLVRALVNSTLVVASIVAIEEAPEGARAFSLSMFALALGFGFAISVVLLPLADLGGDGWRLSFLVSALALVALPGLARHLPETQRFTRLATRTRRRFRLRAALPRYGGRFLALCAVAFLANVFSAPSSQLTNRYLTHTHHFSNASVAAFRTVTAGLPGFLGIILAGRLAETRGRRPVSVVGLVIASGFQMAFFVTSGSVLWFTATIAIVAAASAALSIGALDAELFPTEARGTTNGVLLVCGVAGSAAGLLLATTLEGPVGGLGPAIALCGVAPLLAALVFLPRLPETASWALDDISPSEV
jgi:MFS family permease